MDKSEWQISRRFVRFLLVCFLLCSGLYYFVFQLLNAGGPAPANVALARSDERQLYLSIENYKQAFGSYPTGENASIVRALAVAGDNPQKLRLFYLSINSTNESGEFIDPWKTPYKIVFDGTNRVKIYSAGIDRIFGNADDIIFNSVSNDFVKP